MGEHSSIGASSAYRWMNCPGSVRVLKTVPKKSSEFADEGTVAHMVSELALKTGGNTIESLGKPFAVNGRTWVVSEEMVGYTQEYVDYIRSLFTLPEQLTVEHKFNLDWLFPGMYGTCDALVENPKEMWVNDLKYGAGVSVEAEENPQLMYYGLGALGSAGGKDPDVVHLTIFQPRVEPALRTWATTPQYLREWGRKVLLPAAKATQDKNAPLVAGPWCHKSFCEFRNYGCTAFAESTLALAKSEFAAPMLKGLPAPPPPESLSPEMLAKLLRMLYWADKAKSAYEAYALHLLKNGETLPGLKLVKKRANRVWRNEESSKLFFGEFLKEAAFKPRVIVSPAQMEAAWKKARTDEFPIGHIDKPDGGETIALDEDKRPAIKAMPSALEFIMDEDFMQ